ncbi:MAG: ABC transporter permease [Candidatus Verstraetearchaeota archaeon]|nr:ABC transporter permease [Candidatus Verstraetearchaeota archaeon]
MGGLEIFIDGTIRAVEIILSGNPEIFQITLLSLRVSLTATLLGALFGIPVGYLVAIRNFPGKSLCIAVINTLMGIPPVVVGLVVYLMLSSDGPLGFLRILYTPSAMVIAQTVLTFPVTCGITISSIISLNPRLKETLVSLSAPRFWEAVILINEIRIGIITSFITAFGAAISEVGAIMMVGGNLLGYTRALTTAIVLYTNKGEFSMAIALGIILLILALFVNLTLTALQMHYRRHKG